MGGNANVRAGPAAPPSGAPTLVQTKLSPPLVPHAALRADLLARVSEGARRKLLLVCAPAGYGKSTLLAEAARQLRWRAAWYKLDVLDHDPTVLVASLVQAIRRHVPEFGEVVAERLASARDVPITVPELLALFVTELNDEISGTLHIVLDDYHEASDSTELNKALDYVLANLPQHVHLVLLTRYEPSFSTAKLRLEDQMAELRYEELRFDTEQLSRVLESRTGVRISDERAERLLELTEGWPASIVLACKTLEWMNLTTIEASLTDPRLKHDVFSYLAEQVYRRESEETRAFLKHTCCLEYMTVELANDVAEIDDAQRHLDYLEANQVFTFADAGRTSFRYHNLFRDYLRHKFAQEDGAREFRDVQLRTAEAMERAGDPGVATEIYLSANEPGMALDVLSRAGEALIDNCTSDTLRAWLQRIPAALTGSKPAACLLEGHVSMREGRFPEAISALKRAEQLSERTGDGLGRYEAASALECTYFWKGDLDAATAYSREAIRLASNSAQRAHSLVSLGSAITFKFKWEECECAWAEAKRLCPPEARGELVRIAALRTQQRYLTGDFAKAVAGGTQSLHDARAQGLKSLEAVLLNCLAMYEIGFAAYESARQHVEECLNISDRYGFNYLRHLVEDTLGQIIVVIGDHEEGLDLIRKSTLSEAVADDKFALAMSYSHLGTAVRRNGDLGQALILYRQACNTSAPESYPHLNARANLAYTAALFDGTDWRDELHSTEQAAAQANLAFVSLKSRFFSRVLNHLANPNDGTLDGLIEVIPCQLRLGHRHFLRQELSLQPSLTARVLSGASPALASDLLRVLAEKPPTASLLEACLMEGEDTAIMALKTYGDVLDQTQFRQVAAAVKRLGSPLVRKAFRTLLTASTKGGDEYLSQLTRRESEILDLMARGLRNGEIASQLFLAVPTVKTHVNRIFAKLGVTDRVQAVLYYREHAGD